MPNLAREGGKDNKMSEEETKEVTGETPEVDENESGEGLTDPAIILEQFQDAHVKETEAEEPPETEGPKEPEKEPEKEEETPPETDETKDEEPAEIEPEKEEPEVKETESEDVAKLKDELETLKKRYADSDREVQTKFIPMSKEYETLKSENENLAKERKEISEVLQSDQALLDAFVSAANNPNLVKAPEPKLDKEQLQEAIKETLGEDTFKTLNDLKQEKINKRIKAIDKFENDHKGLTDEDKYKIAQMAGSIEAITKVELETALENAFTALYPDKAFEGRSQAIKEAEKIRALKNKQSTVSHVSTGTSTTNLPPLTAQELKTARKLDMSDTDYQKYKTNS